MQEEISSVSTYYQKLHAVMQTLSCADVNDWCIHACSGLDRSQTYGKLMAQYVAVDHEIYFNVLYSTSEMSAAWYSALS